MSKTLVKPLCDIRATDAAFSGGKGANLGELLAAGLPVPDAFVIGVPARTGTGAAGSVESLDADIRDAVVASYHALGRDIAVAVRSSAVAEDGVDASHAGIYETVLNVRGAAQVLAAVAHCWASASSARARRYRDARELESTGGMAVVVQRQIVPACGGVAFTADPLNGDTDRLVIEFALGSGGDVVDGLVTPARIVVDKSTLGIVEVVPSASAPSLSDNRIRDIADCALRIDRWYGSPQDIEWAFDEQGQIWILQARPITTFSALEARAKALEFYDPPRPPGSRWSRVNVGEALPGVPTPLTWSVWRTGLGEGQWQSQVQVGVVSKRDVAASFVTLAQGWPVISVDLLLSQVARIPGVDPSAFSEQILGAAEHVDVAPMRARGVTALRMAVRAPITLALLNRRLRAVSATSWQAWQRDAWQTPADPVALLTEASSRFRQTMITHALQTYVCQGLYQAVEAVAGSRVIDLLSGDGELPEAHLARDLWLLAGGRITLGRFLSAHGFHGPDEGEIASASWRQDPAPVLHAARVWADADRSRDPVAALDARSDERRRAQSALCESVPRSRRRAVARLIAMARRALVAREIGKTAFLQDLDVARHAASFLGDNAVWHTLSELQSKVHLASADIIARQRIRSQFAAQEPPLSFAGDPPARTAGGGAPVQSLISGAAVSPGRARGRARVVTDPNATVELDADDVLIARTTDPSWVVRFMAVAGMAIDVGGTLSHAAIIARELGIPCVIGTGNGSQVIPDGALVEIDGSAGTVRILDAPLTDRSGTA
ncbi:PEP/pyruvate-binding domain-containing protein [Mycobacterium sp. SMC-19]|uniref:PEP/pyruvate-binding domain-containing protein n=1 Tax=Mycobacterium sp. SMC-19 TaxID=3381630 RepID=UPI003877643D